MPKRIPTPPPGDDEPRYLTVVHPYAISGTCNMELPKDRQDFARWVACCIDENAFFAIYHKPSVSPSVFILVADHTGQPAHSHAAWSSSRSCETMPTLTASSANIAGLNSFKNPQRKRVGESRKSFTALITPGGSSRKTVSRCGRWEHRVLFPWLHSSRLCPIFEPYACLLGWKRIDVDEAWFKAWSPKNRCVYASPTDRS